MLKCKNCGNILSDGVNSCNLCGNFDLEKIEDNTRKEQQEQYEYEENTYEDNTYVDNTYVDNTYEDNNYVDNYNNNYSYNYQEPQEKKIKLKLNISLSKGLIYLIISYAAVILTMIFMIVSVSNTASKYNELTALEFKSYMQTKGYTVRDKSSEIKKSANYVEDYYVATNGNYDVIYISSSDSEQLDALYDRVIKSFNDTEKNSVNRSELSGFNFKKYTIKGNYYSSIIKLDNSVIYFSGSSKYTSQLEEIFGYLGYKNTYGYVVFIILFIIALLQINIVSYWKLFEKANRKGTLSLIPIYNMYVLTKIVLGNGLLFLIMFIPGVNGIYLLYLYYKLAKVFGKSNKYAVGVMLLPMIFLPLLAFDDSKYIAIN